MKSPPADDRPSLWTHKGRIAGAGAAYFALVFGAGFVLGSIRVPFLVPRLGARVAELLEMPVMVAVIFFSARYVVRRFALGRSLVRLAVGGLALAIVVAAELSLAVVVQGQSLPDYFASRDPVSGGTFLAVLGLFALMPCLVELGRK